MFRTSLSAVWVGLAMIASGCGGSEGDLGTVNGKVTLGGKPVPDATVTFIPEDGSRQSVGFTDDQGMYELDYTLDKKGASVGLHKVKITTFEESDGKVTKPEVFPAEYNVKSTLTKEVESGSNEINFDLKEGGEIINDPKEREYLAELEATGGGGGDPCTCGGADFDDF